MPRKSQTLSTDPLMEAAAEYFAGRSHDAWRREFLKNAPAERGRPRMRKRGGVMVDVNQPWSKLHPAAKADNKQAAYDAYKAVQRFPNDREAAADHVHRAWIRRNKADRSLSKALFKPYAQLPEAEKDKDRAHVDNIKKAIAAVKRRAAKIPAARKSPPKTLRIDAKSWAKLEAASERLGRTLGHPISASLVAQAGIKAMSTLCDAIAADIRAKRP